MIVLVVTGAPLTRHAHRGVSVAQETGRPVAVVATEAAGAWLDHDELARLDVPVLDSHRPPGTARRLPRPDAVVLAPATFNTVNKLAAGIADTYALSVLCEALATRRPMTVVPFVSRSLAGHPAWPRSLATLREAGVRLIDPRTGGPWCDEPLEPGTGDAVAAAFDWRCCWGDVRRSFVR